MHTSKLKPNAVFSGQFSLFYIQLSDNSWRLTNAPTHRHHPVDTLDNYVFPHSFTVSMALPSRLIQHNSNDTTTPSSSSRSIRHYNNNLTTPSRFTIGTFNVRGLPSPTKRNQLSEDLGRLHIDICCLQETKCPGGFDEHPGNYRLIGITVSHSLSLRIWKIVLCATGLNPTE